MIKPKDHNADLNNVKDHFKEEEVEEDMVNMEEEEEDTLIQIHVIKHIHNYFII
jgi:hypothetical protein